MENVISLARTSPYGGEAALLMTAGVEGVPYLATGLTLGSVLLGLISYICACWSQRKVFKEAIILRMSRRYSSLNGVRNVQVGLYTLLLIDAMNAIAAIVLATEFVGSTSISELTDAPALSVWFMFRCKGLILHLLNALLCLLFLCHPQLGAKLRWLYRFVIVLVIVTVPFYFHFKRMTIFVLEAITIGLALAIIAKCIVSTVPPNTATMKKLIVLVAMLTFLIVFTPSFVLDCLMFSAAKPGEVFDQYLTIYMNVLLCTNLQLLLDGLLCYFILKLPSEEEEEEEEQQQQQGQSFPNPNYAISANEFS